MKDKIMMFVIGLLVGAVIATGAFFIYTKATTICNTNNNNQMGMPGGNPPSMQDGQPPEKPSDSNTQDSNQNNN